MRGVGAIALVAVGFFLGVGTFTNVSETGPQMLSFLDLRWWWALGTAFIDWLTSQNWFEHFEWASKQPMSEEQ